jgi:hypothetical protein
MAILGLVAKNLLTGYLLCSVLLLAALYFLYGALIRLPHIEEFLGSFVKKIAFSGKLLIAAGSVILILIMLYAGYHYLSWKPISTDEFSYLFQAKLLTGLKIFETAPPESDFFRTDNIIIKDGKWYSKYTIGFPFLLALGLFIRFPWIINPLITIVTLIFLYKFASRIFDVRVGIASVIIAILSPFFFFNGTAPFQPHISLACAILAASYFYFLAITDSRKYDVPAFALCFMIAFLIRPADCFLWAIVILIISVLSLILRKDRGELLKKFALMLVLCCGGLFVGLLVNRMQTGDFLKFAFNQYEVKETWGFGVFEHSIYKAVWNIVYTLSRLVSWGMILFLELVVISLFNREWRFRSLVLTSVMVVCVVFFFGWYALGHYEYGPRYLFTGFVLMMPVAAAGAVSAWDWLTGKGAKKYALAFSFILILFISSAAIVYPVFAPFFKTQVSGNFWLKLYNTAEQIQNTTGEKIAVYVANPPDNRVSNGIRNLCPVSEDKVLYLILLEPDRSFHLAKQYFPDRKLYVAIYNPAKENFDFEPFPDPEKMDAEKKYQYLICAGMSYKFSVENLANAEKFWLEAYNMNPQQPVALINLANLYYEQKQYEKSIGFWDLLFTWKNI